jgi:tetratricopeptide (TPR) repeat protein
MKLKDFDTAHKLLSQEAGGKPGSFIVFDLRAACCLHSGKHDQALDDALLCTKLNPDWWAGPAHRTNFLLRSPLLIKLLRLPGAALVGGPGILSVAAKGWWPATPHGTRPQFRCSDFCGCRPPPPLPPRLPSSRRARGWARLGAANLCLGRQRAAMAAYRRGLELSPGHAEMALGLQLAQQAVLAQGDRRKAMHHAE